MHAADELSNEEHVDRFVAWMQDQCALPVNFSQCWYMESLEENDVLVVSAF